MKKTLVSFAFVLVGLTLLGVADGWAQKKKMMKEPVFWPAGKIQWMPALADSTIMVAVLWGDRNKDAPNGSLVKLRAGKKIPLHIHPNDLRSVVHSGTMIITLEGGAEQRFGPGSYVFMPGGVKHTTEFAPGSDVILFQVGAKKFGMKMVEEKMEMK